MLTRSKAKQQRTQDNGAPLNHNGLQRTGTIILTVPSATGQGTHTRWIRPDTVQTSSGDIAENVADERYITPAPTLLQVPGAPQKAKRVHNRTQASPPVWTLGHMQSIEEKRESSDGEYFGVGSMATLGSPFQFPSETALTVHPPGQALHKKAPQALGPHGTELIDEQSLKGNTIFTE